MASSKKVLFSALVRGSLYDHAVEEGSTITLCGLEAVPEEYDDDWGPAWMWSYPLCPECDRRVHEATARKRRATQ